MLQNVAAFPERHHDLFQAQYALLVVIFAKEVSDNRKQMSGTCDFMVGNVPTSLVPNAIDYIPCFEVGMPWCTVGFRWPCFSFMTFFLATWAVEKDLSEPKFPLASSFPQMDKCVTTRGQRHNICDNHPHFGRQDSMLWMVAVCDHCVFVCGCR